SPVMRSTDSLAQALRVLSEAAKALRCNVSSQTRLPSSSCRSAVSVTAQPETASGKLTDCRPEGARLGASCCRTVSFTYIGLSECWGGMFRAVKRHHAGLVVDYGLQMNRTAPDIL